MNVTSGPNLAILVLSSTFIFVLLTILLAKMPKVGAGVIFALLIVLPLAFLRGGISGGASSLPIFTIWATFLFVLLAVLLAKQPKVGAALIVVLVFLGLFALVLWPLASHRRVARMETRVDAPWATAEVSSPGYRMVPPVPEGREVPPPLPAAAIRPEPAAISPIWSQGVEQEFDADVYPSRLAAVRMLGLRIDKPLREVAGDVNMKPVILFQEEHERGLLVELRNTMQQVLPQMPCTIEAELRNVRPNEVGVTLRLAETDTQPAPWAPSTQMTATSGRIELNLFTTEGRTAASRRFVEKPWIEDFATFTSTRPEQHFIVTRSRGTCTSESEANQQALDDARARLTDALGKRPDWERGALPQPSITTTDVLQGGFIMDRFTQSFEGSASKLWRQALLIDVSGPKLTRLADQKARELRALRMSWARMGFSVVGVLVLIGVIYFFLNMATRGYYEWSLRIAGVVLAILAIISILMVVQ